MSLSYLIGPVVLLAILYYALKSEAYRWGLLASSYAAGGVRPVTRAAKRFEAFVAFGGTWGFTRYVGTTFAITDDGLYLRMIPPLSFFAPPLLLPFEEMQVRPSDWYLNVRTFAITLPGGNGVEILIDEDLMRWIRENSDGRVGS